MPFPDHLFSPDHEYLVGQFSTTYDEIRNFMEVSQENRLDINALALKVCVLGAFRKLGPEDEEDPSHWDETGEFIPDDFESPSRLIEPYPGTVESMYMLTGSSALDWEMRGQGQRPDDRPNSMKLYGGRLVLWGNGRSTIGHLDGILKDSNALAVKKQSLHLTRTPLESLESDNPDHSVYTSGLLPLGRIAVPRL
ncbi:MAG: hypothetical protein ACHQT9_00600 [Candidatus Saccharimonadales bacterium]